jgi:hypothetical protein
VPIEFTITIQNHLSNQQTKPSPKTETIPDHHQTKRYHHKRHELHITKITTTKPSRHRRHHHYQTKSSPPESPKQTEANNRHRHQNFQISVDFFLVFVSILNGIAD